MNQSNANINAFANANQVPAAPAPATGVVATPAPAPVVAAEVDGGQFFIKTLSGKTIVLSLNLDATIKTIKEEIFKAENVPVEQQRLVFQGKQLEDNQTLGSYNVTDKSTLHLVLRLRGGQ